MWFFGLIVVVLIGAVAVVASGRWGAMSTAYDDRPDMTVPARQALTSTDIESARFAVGVRGYRMDEVDTLLERVAKEVAERDRRIADLERAVAPIVEAPDGAGFSSKSPYDASEFEDTGPHQPILVGGDFPVSTPDEPADSTVNVPQVAVPEAPKEPSAESRPAAEVEDDDEPETSELPRTRHEAAADEYERLQAEARAVLEAQSQPVTPRRTPATPTHQPPASTPQRQDDQQPQPPQGEQPQPPQGEQPQSSNQQWPDQQRPQASSQPSRDQQPSQEQASSASSQRQVPQVFSQQPATASAVHWTQVPEPQQQLLPEQQPRQADQATPATHWTQAPPQQQQSPDEQQGAAQEQSKQQSSAPQQGSAESADAPQGEGWQFWPPVEQDGEGAYQRPS